MSNGQDRFCAGGPEVGLQQPHAPHAGALVGGKDEVIDESDVAGLGGQGEAMGGSPVGAARAAVLAWLPMGENEAGAAQSGSVRKDGGGRGDACTRRMGIGREVKAAGVLIEVRHPQRFFARQWIDAAGEEGAGGIDPGEGGWCFGTLKHRTHCIGGSAFDPKRSRVRFSSTPELSPPLALARRGG